MRRHHLQPARRSFSYPLQSQPHSHPQPITRQGRRTHPNRAPAILPPTDYEQLRSLLGQVQGCRDQYSPSQAIALLTPALPLLHRTISSPASVASIELLMWALDQCGQYDRLREVAKSVITLGRHSMPSALWNRACYLGDVKQCDNTALGRCARWLADAVTAIDHSKLTHDVYRTHHAEIYQRIMMVMTQFPLGDTFTLHRLIMGLTNEELKKIATEQAKYNVGGAGALTAPCRVAKDIRRRPKIVFTGEDFNGRPTGLLIRRFIDHPPSDVELHIIQIGNPTPVDNEYSFRAAHVTYHEVSKPEEARAILDREQYDAIIDTKGLMFKNHCCLLEPRRAPLQIHWLAYPGTLGLSKVDYTIGDPIVTPASRANTLVEHVIRMPECYQINDDAYKVADHLSNPAMTRRPGRMLMACVNMNYKICPETVLAWQRILHACPHVDLAIVCRSKDAISNFARAFRASHIDARRLQAHLGQPRSQFLANMRQEVDLVVDPFRCPGHTTASDAYTAGVPVVSLFTDTFYGSVAHSLASTLGFANQLTAYSPEDYIRKTTALLQNKGKLDRLRTEVQRQRRWNSLYDPCRYTEHFWEGIRMALRNAKAGKPVQDVEVPLKPRFVADHDVDGTAFTIHDQTCRAVTRLLLDGHEVMVSPWHGEVWVDDRRITSTLRLADTWASEATLQDVNQPIRFSKSPKGTCVLRGTAPVLLGIPFPTSVSVEQGTTFEAG